MTTTHATLPDGWIETTLGEQVDTIIDNRGKNPPYYTKSGIPVIDNFLIKGDRLIKLSDAKRFIDNDIYQSFIRNYNQPGDIIITLVGNGYGNLALFPSEKSVIIQNTIGIRANTSSNNLFLYYQLRYYIDSILKLNIGAVQPSIKVGDLLKLPIDIPPLPEQQAIAKVLSSFDDKIELLKEQNETLEKLGQTLFKEWFGKYSLDDELPEGWRVGKLGEILKFIKGKKPTETSEKIIDGFLPQILIETFDTGKILYANPKNTIIVDESDLLMVMDGASSGRLEIGYNGIVGSTLGKIEVENDLKLLVFALLKSKFKEINDGTTGSSIPHTDKAKIFDFNYFITDENYLKNFNQLYGNFLQKILENKKQIQTLSKTRDELLPKLMSGEVRVV